MNSQAMLFRNLTTNKFCNAPQSLRRHGIDTLKHDQLFLTMPVNGKCRSRMGMQTGMTLCRGKFNIFGVIVLTSNNDEILDSARNKEFPFRNEPHIPGP